MAILRMVYFGLTWIYQIRFDLVLLPLQSTPKFTVPGKRCTHAPSGGTHPWSHCAPWSCPLRLILTDLMMGSYWAVKSQIHWWISVHPSYTDSRLSVAPESPCSGHRASRYLQTHRPTEPGALSAARSSSPDQDWGAFVGSDSKKPTPPPTPKRHPDWIQNPFSFQIWGGCFGYFSCLSRDILLK